MAMETDEKSKQSFFYKKRNYDSNKDTTITFKGEKEFKKELEQYLKKDYGNTNQGLYHICMDYLNTKTTERTIYPIYIDLVLPDVDMIDEIEECTITKEESGLPNIVKSRLVMVNYSRVEKDDYFYNFYEFAMKNEQFVLNECGSMSKISEYLDKIATIDHDGIRYVDMSLFQLVHNFSSNKKIYRFILNNYLDTYDDGYFDESIHKACFQVCDESADRRFNIIFEYELSKDCTQIIDYTAYLVDDEYFEMLIKNNNQLLFINLYPAPIFEPDYNPEIQEKFDRIAELQEERYNLNEKYMSKIKSLQKEVADLMYPMDK